MAEFWTALTNFVAEMVGRSIAKLFLFGILVFPVVALLGVFGLFSRKRK